MPSAPPRVSECTVCLPGTLLCQHVDGGKYWVALIDRTKRQMCDACMAEIAALPRYGIALAHRNGPMGDGCATSWQRASLPEFDTDDLDAANAEFDRCVEELLRV